MRGEREKATRNFGGGEKKNGDVWPRLGTERNSEQANSKLWEENKSRSDGQKVPARVVKPVGHRIIKTRKDAYNSLIKKRRREAQHTTTRRKKGKRRLGRS